MTDYASQIVLLLNVCFFVLLTTVRFSQRMHVQAAVIIWSVVMLGASLLLAHCVGATGLVYNILGLNLPWFSVVPVSISVVFMTRRDALLRNLPVATAFVVCAFYSLLGGDTFVLSLINRGEADWILLGAMFLTVSSFCVSVLSPLAFLWNPDENIGSTLLRVSTRHIREHWKVLLRGLGWFALAYVVTNIWVMGRMLNLYFVIDPGTFLRDALYTTFFLVLLRHFVYIALAKYAIDALFPGQQTTMWEILVFGCLLAGFQYYLPIGLIVREFLFGLIFGYWYLKTKSLTYGIVARSLSLIFS